MASQVFKELTTYQLRFQIHIIIVNLLRDSFIMTFTKLIAFKKQYLVEKINVLTLELAINLMKQVGYQYNPLLHRFYNQREPQYVYEVQQGINKLLLVKRRSFI